MVVDELGVVLEVPEEDPVGAEEPVDDDPCWGGEDPWAEPDWPVLLLEPPEPELPPPELVYDGEFVAPDEDAGVVVPGLVSSPLLVSCVSICC